MHFYWPRRHRRKLLFPPGLLALSGLLWLGGLVLQRQSERLRPHNVMQLTMPPLQAPRDRSASFPNPWLWSETKLARFRDWREVEFNGRAAADKRASRRLTQAVAAMESGFRRADGVRIRFGPAATYADLIFALDKMNQYNIKKYWLDIRHRPTTLYAITFNALARSQEITPLPPCGGMATFGPAAPKLPFYQSPSYWVRFDNWVTALWNPELASNGKPHTPYATPYWAPALGPERRYVAAAGHYWAMQLRPFQQVAWLIPTGLLILMVGITCWRQGPPAPCLHA